MRTFEAAIESAQVSDYRALDMLADEMGEFLGTRTVREVRAEMASIGPWQGARASAPTVEAGDVPSLEDGHLVLATWRHLLDRGPLQDGEPFLAGTAPARSPGCPRRRRRRPRCRRRRRVTVGSATPTVTAPVLVSEHGRPRRLAATNSVGSDLRAALGRAPGALVAVTKEDQA